MSHLKRAACIFLERNGQYLVVSRLDNRDHFGLPGGRLEPGESAFGAALREAREETGIIVTYMAPEPMYTAVDSEGWETSTFRVTSYVGEPTQQPGEGTIRWVTADELCAGPFADYNRELLTRHG